MQNRAWQENMGERQIAHLAAPALGATIACRAEPALAGRPLILLDDQGCVLAADPLAMHRGVAAGMAELSAVTLCPDAQRRSAARYPILAIQAALWERLADYTDRWQPAGLGSAYLDATGAGKDLLSWCQALGGEVRRLGLAPALGVTGSKFGATAAGQTAGGYAALLLKPNAQRAFLASCPITLLPLDTDALTQLRHLGIRTLGQFARLPSAGILARFGEAGRTAQRWALGQDDRPVIPPQEAGEVSARIEFDGPVTDRGIVLTALTRRAERLLAPLRSSLQAVGRLSLSVTQADGRKMLGIHTFPMPTAAAGSIRFGLTQALERVTGSDQGIVELTLILAGITDAPAQQLDLFDIMPTARRALVATLDRLAARFGPETFRMATLSDPESPLPERQVSWQRFH